MFVPFIQSSLFPPLCFRSLLLPLPLLPPFSFPSPSLLLLLPLLPPFSFPFPLSPSLSLLLPFLLSLSPSPFPSTIFKLLKRGEKKKALGSSQDRVAEYEGHIAREEHKQANEQIGKAIHGTIGNLDKLLLQIDFFTKNFLQKNNKKFIRGAEILLENHIQTRNQQIEAKARKFNENLIKQTNWHSVPYEKALFQLNYITEVENKRIYYENKISDTLQKLFDEEKEKERITKELTTTKDLLASKKDQLTSLLAELSNTRQKYTEIVPFPPSPLPSSFSPFPFPPLLSLLLILFPLLLPHSLPTSLTLPTSYSPSPFPFSFLLPILVLLSPFSAYSPSSSPFPLPILPSSISFFLLAPPVSSPLPPCLLPLLLFPLFRLPSLSAIPYPSLSLFPLFAFLITN